MSIREWSLGRVVLISVLWALVVLVLSAWRAFTFMRGQGEHGGLVGVSAGISDLLKVAALVLVPPLILFAAWVVQKR